jgi:hypothetical protein
MEYSWNYKFCHLSDLVIKTLAIPAHGVVLQMGTAYGCSLEKLCSIYGKERVIGWDIENPMEHPNVSIVDCDGPLPAIDLAFVHVDVGRVDVPETRDLRIKSLKWASQNVITGGYLFTIGYTEYVTNMLQFDVVKYLESQNFECVPASNLIDPDKVEFFKIHNNFDLGMEVIAKKI